MFEQIGLGELCMHTFAQPLSKFVIMFVPMFEQIFSSKGTL